MSKKDTTPTTEHGRKESKYNAKALRELIEQGHDAKHIMHVLDIKSKQSLKQYVLRLCSDEKQYFEVVGLHTRSSKHLKVTSKGELRIVLKNIDTGDLVVNEGDEFQVDVEVDKIILTKI